MKKNIVFICLILFMNSCKSEQNPKDVVLIYLNSIDKYDFIKAEEQIDLNGEVLRGFNYIKAKAKKMTESEKKAMIQKPNYNIVLKTNENGFAKVFVSNIENEARTYIIDFYLKKINGKWKIYKIESNT
ncbi:DUF4878 domain-containing protein [Flavobacterium sp.]|uniref:DUF4878 domain-containing protein n=1 Tax=Flavobacterium sp. TaxID=239 RepID=UPI00286B5E7B|nr:DUF4878 domain-containing protein [Flavobacterium sp.]